MTSIKDPLIETLQDDLVLTTKDNPYSPKTQYDKWKNWDEDAGYHTESYLARVANIPLDVSDDDDVAISLFTNKAIQSILENDPLGIYILV